jgi:hypothetical protein
MIVTVEALPGGQIIHLRLDGLDLMCREPGEPTQVFHFDDATNPELVEAMRQNPYRFNLLGGKLYRDGVEVAVNPPSAAYTDYQAARTLAQDARAFLAFDPSGKTAAQILAALVPAVKAHIRLTLVLARLLLREVQD